MIIHCIIQYAIALIKDISFEQLILHDLCMFFMWMILFLFANLYRLTDEIACIDLN